MPQDFQLPSIYAVRRYVRERQESVRTLTKLISGEHVQGLRDHYSAGKMAAIKLETIANEHEAIFHAAGCFGVKRGHLRGSKAMPQRERHSVAGFFLTPIALGQGGAASGLKPYTENVLMLQVVQTYFAPKKAFIGIGASTLFLTQHTLERVYERTQIDHEQLTGLIHSEVESLLGNLSLADTANLWVLHGNNRLTAVPYANGLLILNTRIVFGNADEGEFGFRIEIPKGRLQTPYMNNGMRLDDLAESSSGDFTPAATVCSLTYLSLEMLGEAQSDYYYAFQALKDSISTDVISALAQVTFAPNMDHERWGGMDLSHEFDRLRARAQTLINKGWLKSDKIQPVGCILPFDTKPPSR